VHLLTRIFDFTERDGRNRDPCFRRTPLAKKSHPDRLFDLKKLKLFAVNNPPFRTRLPYPHQSGTSSLDLSLQLYRYTVVANANIPTRKDLRVSQPRYYGELANKVLPRVTPELPVTARSVCTSTHTILAKLQTTSDLLLVHINSPPRYTTRTYGRIN
jgi:hypothetical protein